MTRLRNIVVAIAAPVLAIVFALLVTSIVIQISGGSAMDFIEIIFSWPSDRLLVNITNQAVMIYLAALAAAVGFRMNLFNIGIEGQYRVAGYAAAVVAGAAILPGFLNVALAILAAIAVGAAWAGIAAVLRVTRGVSEVISTIMLNAIAVTLTGYLLHTYGIRKGDSRQTTAIPESSQVPGWNPFSEGSSEIWSLGLLAVIAGVAFWLVLNKTRFGFDLRATGQSETAAVASGVSTKKMTLIAMLISGGIAGLVWLPSLFGGAHYYGSTFQTGLGFTGIAVALLGRNRALPIAFAALLFAFLNAQSNRLTIEAGISVEVIQITQGVIVLAVVIAYELVRRYRVHAEERDAAEAQRPGSTSEEVPV
ncbi:ABC transporter permease [Mumia zhuanghuii]|uniref:ABC transporter permease n=1 Tax=Mumia zhuanghuii TaxID=2585211 RepID=A0A5C4MG45_9ACTN|nr:ABC transporter permease [Mumia zhuanghuii]TNC36512.1 ABC transporter permease [Mumia zhuanghuii]TNC44964.1 ABC transporter permease [Mumia zhuanghuii]